MPTDINPNVRRVTTLQGLEALRPDWETLEKLDDRCTPFNTWDWCQLWWYHYGAYAQLNILAVYDGEQLVGLLPLYRHDEKDLRFLPVTVLRFIGSRGDDSPGCLTLLVRPGHLRTVVPCLVEALRVDVTWRKLHLSDLRTDSLVNTTFTNALNTQRGTVVAGRRQNVLHDRLPTTWDAWRARLSRKRRKQINHWHNRLDNAGEWSVALCHGEDETEHGVAALVRLHRQRWLSKAHGDDYGGDFASGAHVDFHRGVIERFCRRRVLWLATLRLEGEIIGAMYLFHWQDTLLFFQSGFSPKHEDLSPGHVLFTAAINRAIELGIGKIDLLTGDHAFRHLYASQERTTADYILLRPGRARLIDAGKQLVSRMLQH